MPITSESFKLNGTDINPADELTTSGSIKYTATLASADGTSRPIDLGLDLPADLFASSAVLNITNISTPRQISIPIKVDFTYASGPMAFFRARFFDITNNIATIIPIPSGSNSFNYTPKRASARCKFEIEAFDPSTPTRIYANISSAEFAVVAGPPPPPPSNSITIPFVNDFTISENRPTIPFSYSGPAVNEFRVEFLNQDVPFPAYVLIATLPSSATSFSFTAPSTTSNKCFFRIKAISSSGTLLTQQFSNQFKITSGPSPSSAITIDPISTPVSLGTTLNVRFRYTGPSVISFKVGISNKGQTTASPIYSQTIRSNPTNIYTLPFNIGNNPALISANCFVFVTTVMPGGSPILEYSNQFELTAASPPSVPELEILSPVPGSSLASKSNQIIKWRIKNFPLGRDYHIFVAESPDLHTSINGKHTNKETDQFSSPWVIKKVSTITPITLRFHIPEFGIDKNFDYTILPSSTPPPFEDFKIIHFKDPINDSKQLIPRKLVPEVRSFYSFIAKLYSSIKGSNNPFESANLNLKDNLLRFLLALNKFPTTLPLPTAPELNQIIDFINQNLENFVNSIASSGLALSKGQEYLMFVKQSVIRINKIIAAINGEGTEPSEPGVPLFDLYIGGSIYDKNNPFANAFDLSNNNEASFFIRNKSKSKILNWNGIITPYPFNGVPVFKLEQISDKLNGGEERTYKISVDRNSLNQLIQTKPNIKPNLQLFFRGGNFSHNPFSLRSLFSREKTTYVLIPIRFQ
jgi:cold shock CspA family protein